EIDTGLDVDSLKSVSESINRYIKSDKKPGVLIISHYQRIFNYIKPNFVHVLIKGNIVKTGNYSLINRIEKKGYATIVG
ncbi:Fe-S cluster assembly ATPase SufC, partial [Candidatus Gottesmanbacteria bacterium]|nr:Fe-S cluster assembly ATPase SufC [Candidatus Gottesmanbacteria bacterium]